MADLIDRAAVLKLFRNKHPLELYNAIAALPARGVRVKPLVWGWNERECMFEAENPVTLGTMSAENKEQCKIRSARYEARILAVLEPASGGVEAEPKRLRAAVQDMVTVARQDGWAEATTGRQIVLRSVEDALVAHRDTPAPVATDRVEALVKAAEAMVKRGVVNQDECGGCVECGSTGVNGGDYGYAGEADEDHEPDCPYIMLRAALAAYRGDAK